MLDKITRITRYEIPIRRRSAIPGLSLILITIIIRLFGGLQFLEWMLLDTVLRMRPAEAIEEKVIIVGINEQDIQKIGRYPVPDREIAALI